MSGPSGRKGGSATATPQVPGGTETAPAAPASGRDAAGPHRRRPLRWTEYLSEATCLGLFMVSAAGFGVLLEHPASPARQALPDPLARRALMGLAMGLTAVGLIYSPMGQRSGAHMNPAVTLAFWRLGKVEGRDAASYAVAQFFGGAAGIWLASLALPGPLAHPSVLYVATLPGASGRGAAWIAEAVISFLMMTTVLAATNTRRLARWTGVMAGCLVALCITFEAPLSGMSMNPARSFGSALRAQLWTGFWIYMTAPPLAMLAAAQAYVRVRGAARVHCAKLHHENGRPCIFRCEYGRMAAEGA